MKKLIYILTACLLSGCVITEGYEPDGIDYFPTASVRRSAASLKKYLQLLSYAQIIERYAQASDEERIMIEDSYFPQYKIRPAENGWELRSGNTPVIRFDCGGSLTAQGSEWRIFSSLDIDTREKGVVITSAGDNVYSLAVTDASTGSSVETGEFTVKLGEEIGRADLSSGPIFVCEVTGHSRIDQNGQYSDMLSIEYHITRAWIYGSTESGATFIDGEATFEVTDTHNNRPLTAPFAGSFTPEGTIKTAYLSK